MAAEKYRLPEKKRFNFKLMQRLLPTQFSLDKTADEDLPHIFPGKTSTYLLKPKIYFAPLTIRAITCFSYVLMISLDR